MTVPTTKSQQTFQIILFSLSIEKYSFEFDHCETTDNSNSLMIILLFVNFVKTKQSTVIMCRIIINNINLVVLGR